MRRLLRLRWIFQVEETARRQDADRTSIAQAKAQSATELSTSRRLKSELTRAVSVHQRNVGYGLDLVARRPFGSGSGSMLLAGQDRRADVGSASGYKAFNGDTSGPWSVDGIANSVGAEIKYVPGAASNWASVLTGKACRTDVGGGA